MVDWRFLPQNFAFCGSVNADGVGIIVAGGRDPSTLHVMSDLFALRSSGE